MKINEKKTFTHKNKKHLQNINFNNSLKTNQLFKNSNFNRQKLTPKKTIFSILIILIFIFVSYSLIIKPTITGYTTHKAMEKTNLTIDAYALSLTELQNEIAKQKTNLSSCYTFNKDLFEHLEKNINQQLEFYSQLTLANDELSEKKEYINKLSIESQNLKQEITNQKIELIKDCENQIIELKKNSEEEVIKIQKKYNNTLSDYQNLATNTANNICCKSRVDNPQIDSYTINNNRIICASQAEFKINCN
jgi:hypothetical protein